MSTTNMMPLMLVAAVGTAGCGDERRRNRPPVVLFGYDQVVSVGESITLDAAQSFDPDGDLITLEWTLDARPSASGTQLEEAGPTGRRLTIDAEGAYAVTVAVSDGQATARDTIRLTTDPDLGPTADAGPDRSAFPGQQLRLDGSGSSTGEGGLMFRWRVSQSAGDHRLLDQDTAIARFIGRVEGTFEVELEVTDETGASDTDAVEVRVRLGSGPPTADAGPDQDVDAGATVQLDGAGSADPDGDPLTYQWRVRRWPPGSNEPALDDATALRPTFVPADAGDYEIGLTVSDGGVPSLEDTVLIRAHPPVGGGAVTPLDFRVTDVEYSRGLDRLVLVSTESRSLTVYDPLTETGLALPLNQDPTCVSVSPDGLFAAVGHDGSVSHVDLSLMVVLSNIAVPLAVDDIVLGDNGYIYARAGVRDGFRSIELSTETVTESNGFRFDDTDRMRLHPAGDRIYAANRGVSPDDIVRIDIAGGVASDARDSQYHGDYPMCGDLWLSRDGARIFTACGNVFRASPDQASDMSYNGSLPDILRVGWIDHSVEAARIAAVGAESFQGGSDRVVRFYGDEFLTFEEEVELPTTDGGATGRIPWSGRYAFYSSDGARLFVVVQAAPEAGLLTDFGVHVID